jgi:hypothetical protein
MRIEHGLAPRDVTDEQNYKDGEEDERRPQASRTEIKVGMNKINSDAGGKHSPAATVAPMRINESRETQGKHPCQCL